MNWLHYLLQVNLYLVLFYGFYHVALRKETFFHLNRVYLLGAAALSFFIPLIQSTWVRAWDVTERVSEQLTVVYVPLTKVTTATPAQTAWPIGMLLAFVYITGVLVGVARLSLRMAYLGNLLRGKHKGEQPKQAFSFFNFLFVSQDLPMRQVILEHEYVHIRQLHSADVLLFELIAIFNWFNPVLWLYKKAIRYIHEFIADDIASRQQPSKEAYAMILFNEEFGVKAVPIANNFFNQSLLKTRVMMLLKERSHKQAMLRYGLVLPLFLWMVIISSASLSNPQTFKRIAQKISTITRPEKSKPSKSARQVLSEAGIDVSQATLVSSTIAEELQAEKQARLTDSTNQKEEEIFTVTQQMPSFPGGQKALQAYLAQNIKATGAKGTVYTQFIVNKDGSLQNFKVLNETDPKLATEAMRVLRAMPAWEPGRQDQRPLRCYMILPIRFE